MSSVSQVASGGGELSSLNLFGCRTNSPPMSANQPPALAQPAEKGAISAPASMSPADDLPREVPTRACNTDPSDGDDQSIVERRQPQKLEAYALDSTAVAAAERTTEVEATSIVAERSGKVETHPKKTKLPESKLAKSAASELPADDSPTSDLQRGAERVKAACQTLPRTALNRIAKVREQQGISERTMARRLGVDIKRYRQIEDPDCDLTLSQLNAIQQALDVPISDLLEERQGLSRPVEERAKLLKVMKTAVALRDAKINARADRMAQMLCDQLVDLMPELAEVSGWPQFGARRGISAVGKALQQPIDTSNIHFQD